jgi:hypothetical protein
MGKNINGLPLETTVVDGSLVYVGTPGGANPDPFEDKKITKVDFFLPLQTQITGNEDDIAILEDSVATLEELLAKSLDKAQNASYQPAQNADSRIINFGFRYVSGTPIVKVGTAVGLEDIVDEATVSTEYSYDVSEYSEAGRTLYITITGGTVDVVILSRENLYEV